MQNREDDLTLDMVAVGALLAVGMLVAIAHLMGY